ncbi:ATP-dependent DNA ligase [Agromyces sp. NPDC057679]|uniref:ATP-dependent DNA ligase n=1 Tax=Agromyces sp. NPDC057679 TaxID=3346207 RepID=UPI0036729F92
MRYEPKLDGFRAVIAVDSGTVSVWSRQQKRLTDWFPEVAAAAAAQIPDGVVVDGEIVAISAGRLDFEVLQRRLGTTATRAARLARDQPASFVAFDVLAVLGVDVRPHTLHARRELLVELAAEWSPPLQLGWQSRELEQATAWFNELTSVGIEGIVAKGAAQPYAGDARDWVKVKRRDVVDVIIGAAFGPIDRPEALVVGLYDEGGRLRVAGRTSPLKPSQARQVGSLLRPPSGAHPWPTVLSPGALGGRFTGARELVRLTLVDPVAAEVSADVAMSGRSFRHLVRFVRLRPDLPAGPNS